MRVSLVANRFKGAGDSLHRAVSRGNLQAIAARIGDGVLRDADGRIQRGGEALHRCAPRGRPGCGGGVALRAGEGGAATAGGLAGSARKL